MRLTEVPQPFLLVMYLSLASARRPGLSKEELRKIVLELVKSEVGANLPHPSAPLPFENGLGLHLLEIQRSLNETKIQTEDLIRGLEEGLQQTERQCSSVLAELVPGGSSVFGSSASHPTTIREEIRKMSRDVVEVKENLQTMEGSLRGMSVSHSQDRNENDATTMTPPSTTSAAASWSDSASTHDWSDYSDYFLPDHSPDYTIGAGSSDYATF